MISIIFFIFTLQGQAFAGPLRNVQMSEGDMATVYVQTGYSTLIKFDSHPEPGLIGDQDSFKVEYMRNMVAIKPLVSRGKTNLFLFTKEGQFNFQLVSGAGTHDNIIYAQRKVSGAIAKDPRTERAVLIDDLLTRKINKAATIQGVTLRLESVATPTSKSTVLLRFVIIRKTPEKPSREVINFAREDFMILQDRRSLSIENIYLETKGLPGLLETKGLILIRADGIKKNDLLILKVRTDKKQSSDKNELQVSFMADFGKR